MTKDYYGTKRVTAWPCKKNDMANRIGVSGGPDGYAVRYCDGWMSWSPKEAFEKAYEPVDAMSFSGALKALKDGHRVTRAGWTKGRFIEIARTSKSDAYFCAGTKPGGHCGPWTARDADLLAEDWAIVEADQGESDGEES